jgi:hypothetical protein
MSSRKKTPDVLSEVLGAAPGPLPESSLPAPQKPLPTVGKPRAKAKPRARKTQVTTPIAWAYREVTIRDYRGWRPRHVDGVEIEGWKDGPLFRDYLTRLGEEGWEMTGIVSSGRSEREVYFKRPA